MSSPPRPPPEPEPRPRWELPGAIGLAVLHLALGAIALPEWLFAKYPDAARLFRLGKLGAEQGSDFSPLYLLLNLALGPGALRWVQGLLGACCVLFAFWIGRACFGRWTGLLAATALTLAEPLLLYEATLEPDLWVATFSFGAIAALCRRESQVQAALAAGLLIGAAVALRPSSGLLALGLAGVLAVRAVRRRPGSGRALLLAVTGVLSTALLPPAALRWALDTPPGATMSAGQVFQMGSRPEGTGVGPNFSQLAKLLELQKRSPDRPDYSHVLYRELARGSERRPLTAFQAEAFWFGKSVAFARWEPWAFTSLWGRKAAAFLLGPDAHDLIEVRRAHERLRDWPLFGTQLLDALGLAGLLLAAWRREALGWPLLAVCSALAMGVVFYVISRYRLAGLLPLTVFAARWVVALADGRRAPLELGRAALTLSVVALWWTWAPFLRDSSRLLARSGSVSSESIAFEQERARGDLRRATELWVRIQAAQPMASLVDLLRGVPFESPEVARASGARAAELYGLDSRVDALLGAELARRAGACDRAVAVAHDLGPVRVTVFDRVLDPELLEASCAAAAKDWPTARAAVERSLQRWPGTVEGLALAIAAATREADPPRVRQASAELDALHDALTAGEAKARAHNLFGNWSEARQESERVLEILPDAAVVEYQRAVALAGLGRAREAVASYGKALAEFPDYGFETRPLDASVRARLTESPTDPEVLSIAAEHLLRTGQLQQAQELAARATAGFGPFAPSWHQERVGFLRRAALATGR